MSRQKKQSTAQPLLLTVSDVAIQLGVCRATVYNLMYNKGLPSVTVGGQRRFYPESIHNWIKQNERVA